MRVTPRRVRSCGPAVLGVALLGVAVLGAALLLSSCPRAGVLPYGVEVSEGEGGGPVYRLVKAPTFDLLDTQIYSEVQTLHLSTATPDTYIRYTTISGTEPDTDYDEGTGILLAGTTTVRARAYLNSNISSLPTEKTFTFKVPEPVFSPEAPPIQGVDTTVIVEGIEGSTIIYSNNINNLNLSAASPATITVGKGKTLYAKARLANWNDSNIVSRVY